MKPFYITTTLPYVNADPHIGHAMEFIRADVIARFQRSLGRQVFFNTGTDEHGQKIYEGAEKEGMSPEAYADKYSDRFKEFCKLTNISYDGFLRTTDTRHIAAAQKMWSICLEKGDIYKAKQIIKYCVGCEMEKTDSELVDDKCPDHTNRDLVVSEEENYFFKFSKYQDELLKLYDRGLVKPDYRQNEIRNFVASGLHDFSVSRLKSKMPWGVAVPGDDEHVMYVWFDALNSYISTLGWGTDEKDFHFWNNGLVVQYCGKDNNKAQSAIWQAMLLSAGIKNTDIININGHIISGGVKMSKSLGNVINPFDVIEKYKVATPYAEEVLRFVMCHEVSTYDDSDITAAGIDVAYSSYLQNGIGNLTNRVMKMATTYGVNIGSRESFSFNTKNDKVWQEYEKHLNNFDLNGAIKCVTFASSWIDSSIQQQEPFKVFKVNPDEAKKMVLIYLEDLYVIAEKLEIFMPRTSAKILECIKENRMPEVPMFNRLG